jgi:oxaloacetate decarboxylase gamma subunit
MLVGMGVVFGFLGVLIFCTSTMSSLISRYFPVEEAKPAQKRRNVKNTSQSARKSDDELAAISAAIHHHRNK